MPKTFIAQNVISVNPLRWVWEEGELIGLVVGCEVNYGERGMPHQLDIYPYLTEAERGRAKTIYQAIKQKVETIILE